MSKYITCKNEDNVQIVFDYDFNPFFLLYCDGIMSVYNNVATSENTMIDGSTYQGSTTRERNITIGAQMCNNYSENREILYRAFKPKATGTFTYYEDGEQRTIDYEVESIEIAEAGIVRDIVISLKCPDPFFKALEDTTVEMAAWDSLFEFEHEFIEEGEAFADRVADIIKEIPNECPLSAITSGSSSVA